MKKKTFNLSVDCDYRLEIRFWKVLAIKLVANYSHGMGTFKKRGNSGTFPYGENCRQRQVK